MINDIRVVRFNDIVVYFSVSNDKISIPGSDKATWKKIKKSFPHSKHRTDYPIELIKKKKGEHFSLRVIFSSYICIYMLN